MPSKRHLPVVPVLGALLIAGCVSGSGTQTVKVVPQAPAPVAAPKPTPEPTPDPIAILIATSDRHFEAGQKELALGHLERAKAEFNRALDTLLESPDGARGNRAAARALRSPGRSHQRPRTGGARHRRRLLRNQVGAGGDRRAAGDRNLRVAVAEAGHGRDGAGRPAVDHPRHSDPDQRPRAALRRAVPGPAARIPDRRACRAACSTCR